MTDNDAGWSFYAIGDPAPQGSKRHVGGGRMIESSKKVAPWRDTVTAAAYGAGPCLDGPIAVRMAFTVARPKSAPKRQLHPFRTPDLSKLCRSTEDAITNAGLWADDARVATYWFLEKLWPAGLYGSLPVPGVIIAAIPTEDGGAFDYEQLEALFRDAHQTAWAAYEKETA